METMACRPKNRIHRQAQSCFLERPTGRGSQTTQLCNCPGTAWELGLSVPPRRAPTGLAVRGGRGESLPAGRVEPLLVPTQHAGDTGTQRPWRNLP